MLVIIRIDTEGKPRIDNTRHDSIEETDKHTKIVLPFYKPGIGIISAYTTPNNVVMEIGESPVDKTKYCICLTEIR